MKLAAETQRRRGSLFKKAFVIETSLSPAEVLNQLAPRVITVQGFWGWVNFWATWSGQKNIRFAGRLEGQEFGLRRIHGLRLIDFVSVKARGRIVSEDNGSRIAVSVTPTLEEFWFFPVLMPLAFASVSQSASATENIVSLALIIGLPLGWFFVSRARESAEMEAQLRLLLTGDPGNS
jgi:hypothetical protein